MKAKAFLLLPITLLLAISVSGCTIPGLPEICIPGFGTCGGTVEYENDIIVIRSLDAVPSTVSTGQQFRLSAWIENRGSETVPQTEIQTMIKDSNDKKVIVELYDSCEGLFESIKVNCPGEKLDKKGTVEPGCKLDRILPKQTVPISWTLTAKKASAIPLQTSCNLKVYVRYPYETDSITSITFIDYIEMQRMIAEGKFSAISSYITEGYGPIKPYLTAEDTQPIPVQNGQESTTAIGFQIKNKGSGFQVGWKSGTIEERFAGGFTYVTGATRPVFTTENIIISPTDKPENYPIGKYIKEGLWERIAASGGSIELIGKESPKQIFPIRTPWEKVNLPKVATYHITTSIDYLYEFRKEIKVTIKPPKVTS